jgi:hypothetical protein
MNYGRMFISMHEFKPSEYVHPISKKNTDDSKW